MGTSWTQWPDRKLLDLRLCDLPELGVSLGSAPVRPRLQGLLAELSRRGLRFRPHFWLSDEWFSPDGIPGIAVPFYLAHPRLLALEKRQMGEAEGETATECRRILRHEAGHAIENAYRLRRLAARRAVFGRSTEPYPSAYSPRPYSRRYVRHLSGSYAQSHPDEDFAETFAVWLAPRSRWRERYAGWPALEKLLFVDSLMKTIARKRPPVTSREEIYPLGSLTTTLRRHYEKRRRHFGLDADPDLDARLKRIFGRAALCRGQENMTAAAFLRKIRRVVRRRITERTGEYGYSIDRVLEKLIHRSESLGLTAGDAGAYETITPLVQKTTEEYLARGRHRIAF